MYIGIINCLLAIATPLILFLQPAVSDIVIANTWTVSYIFVALLMVLFLINGICLIKQAIRQNLLQRKFVIAQTKSSDLKEYLTLIATKIGIGQAHTLVFEAATEAVDLQERFNKLPPRTAAELIEDNGGNTGEQQMLIDEMGKVKRVTTVLIKAFEAGGIDVPFTDLNQILEAKPDPDTGWPPRATASVGAWPNIGLID